MLLIYFNYKNIGNFLYKLIKKPFSLFNKVQIKI